MTVTMKRRPAGTVAAHGVAIGRLGDDHPGVVVTQPHE